jgi:hypothetical protein
MNDEENEKIISWRKKDKDKDNKSINFINSTIINNKKKYSNKEKEYINKYLIISKNIINEEKLYNIITKFNFNDQLILSEIFHILDEESEKESNEGGIDNINIIKTNESIFVPYKTQFGIMKSIYSLKNENKSKTKVLSKDKKIYKYEKININKNFKNEEKNDKQIYSEDILDKNQLYPKRFSNFNKIIEDYKNKKYKENNNNFYKKINKIHYKNKYFGGKINSTHINNNNNNNNNDNDITSHKYYNSKQYNNENNEKMNIIKHNNFMQENVINFEFINQDLKIKEKNNQCLLISDKSELIIEAISTNKEKEENDKDILLYNKKEENKDIIDNNIIYKKINLDKNYNIKSNKKIIFSNKPINYKYINEDKKDYTINYNNLNTNFINYQATMNFNNNNNNNYNNFNYKSINYIESNKSNFLNNSYNYNNNNNNNFGNNIIYYNVNINPNKSFNNNNILFNQKIGVPIYFYPLYFKSNNIMMAKNINMNPHINNNYSNSLYNPNMIRMYYQGLNNHYMEKTNNINMINKNFNYKNMTPINPMIYYLLMRKFGLKFAPNQNFRKTN